MPDAGKNARNGEEWYLAVSKAIEAAQAELATAVHAGG
jgi:hypothetical protein